MSVAQLVGDECSPIGGDTDEVFSGLPFALAEVVGQLPLGVGPLAPQVGLELEDGPAQQGVDASVHLRHWTFKVYLGTAGAQAMHQ